MKTTLLFPMFSRAARGLGLTAECQAGPWSGKLHMAVVAEQADPAVKLRLPTAETARLLRRL